MNRTSPGNSNVTTSDIEEVVRRIVAAVRPHKANLSGSAAQGALAAHRDPDTLVVTQGAARGTRGL